MSGEHFTDHLPKWLHYFLCHILWFDHPVRIVHRPTRKYECKVCGHTYRDPFLEF